MTPMLPLLVLLTTALATPTATASDRDIRDLALQVREHRQAREAQIIDDFVRLLSLPNLATSVADIERNAEHIVPLLQARGFETRLLRGAPDTPPAIFGERKAPGATRTIVLYAHYDGQPVEAANWASPPWTPVLRDGLVEAGGRAIPIEPPFDPESRLFARSAGDDKAPVIALIHALDALDDLGVALSVNLKLYLDGEEEIGSPNMPAILDQHAELLRSDLWLFCDGPMHPSRRPQIAYGVRGWVGFDLTVFGATRPLHSGHYGNWAPNPVAMLTRLMASMRDDDGTVLIPGFYDEANEPTRLELAAIEAMPEVDLALKSELGLGRTESPHRIERAILKPALNFRGIRAGDVGDAARNIILPSAQASVGIRLVPGQTIPHLYRSIQSHLESQGYHVVTEAPDEKTRSAHPRLVQVRWRDGYPAYRTPLDHPMASAVADILDAWSGGLLIRAPTMGGSLPLYVIPEKTGTPVIILPVANHDNNQHGKDENLRLQNLWDAIELYAVSLAELGQRLESFQTGK